jgi:hypothetical protein
VSWELGASSVRRPPRWRSSRSTASIPWKLARRRARRSRVPPANLLSLLPLLRGENRVDLAPRPADDRVQLRLYRSSHRPQLSSLTSHDGVNPAPLLGRESHLAGETIPEFSPRPMLEPPPPERLRQKHQSIDRDPGHPTRERHQQQHQGGQEWASGPPRSSRRRRH